MKELRFLFFCSAIFFLSACDITYEFNKNTGENHKRAEECRQRLHIVEMLSYNECLNTGKRKEICDSMLMGFSVLECGCNGKEKADGMDNSGMCGM